MINFEVLDDVNKDLMPMRSTLESAGYDLKSAEDGILQPGERKLVKTGVTVNMPSHIEGQIRPRSGLALKHGITVLNAPGTIDSDYYPGEIGVILINHGDKPYQITRGERIAQIVFSDVYIVENEVIKENVRTGGFGHTGTN